MGKRDTDMSAKNISRILLAALMLSVFADLSRAEIAGEPKTLEEAGIWMMTYYEKPEPRYVVPSLKLIVTDETFISDQIHNQPVKRFFAVLVRDNPSVKEPVKQLCDSLPGNKKDYVAGIIQQADTFREIEYPNDAQEIDFLWSEFFATGSDKPVKKIVKTFTYIPAEIDLGSQSWQSMEKVPSRDVALRILQAAAKWSLVSNAAQHKRVYDVIELEARTVKDDRIKRMLTDILQDADKAKNSREEEKKG